MKQTGYVVLSPVSYFDINKMRIVFTDGSPAVPLSNLKFKVLYHLVDHEGTVVSKDDLIDYAWGVDNSTGTIYNSLANIISELKKDAPSLSTQIQTIHSVGYLFERENLHTILELFGPEDSVLLEKKKTFERYLDKAVAEHLTTLEKRVDELLKLLLAAKDQQLSSVIISYYNTMLESAIEEYDTLKKEIDCKHDAEYIPGQAESCHGKSPSLCNGIEDEIAVITEKLHFLTALKEAFCAH